MTMENYWYRVRLGFNRLHDSQLLTADKEKGTECTRQEALDIKVPQAEVCVQDEGTIFCVPQKIGFMEGSVYWSYISNEAVKKVVRNAPRNSTERIIQHYLNLNHGRLVAQFEAARS